MAVIDTWRAAHRSVLNTFQAILRNRASGQQIVVAQRHKRKRTIFDKLHRLPKMELARMDDIAGCRLIFRTIEDLYDFRIRLHAAPFKHRRRNEIDKYDYIKRPKKTGYRGVHDVYDYDVNSIRGRDYKGLFIELQYRTLVQHAWATAAEVIGLVTQSQPKFQQGDMRYESAMSLASEILARAFENGKSYHADMTNESVVEDFLRIDSEIGLMRLLRGLNASNNIVSSNRNIILMLSDREELEIKTYRDATEALRALFVLEKQNPGKDLVLVRAAPNEDVREAFRNYFSDATEFIRYIDEGCRILSGKTVIKCPSGNILNCMNHL